MTANPVFAYYIKPPETIATELASYFPDTLSGWDDLRRAINQRLPQAVKAANQANRAAAALLGVIAKRR
jgi:hypothetical protein